MPQIPPQAGPEPPRWSTPQRCPALRRPRTTGAARRSPRSPRSTPPPSRLQLSQLQPSRPQVRPRRPHRNRPRPRSAPPSCRDPPPSRSGRGTRVTNQLTPGGPRPHWAGLLRSALGSPGRGPTRSQARRFPHPLTALRSPPAQRPRRRNRPWRAPKSTPRGPTARPTSDAPTPSHPMTGHRAAGQPTTGPLATVPPTATPAPRVQWTTGQRMIFRWPSNSRRSGTRRRANGRNSRR